MLEWADVVFVMEQKHKMLLAERFPYAARNKKIVVLNIEDNYQFGDAELISIIKNALHDYL